MSSRKLTVEEALKELRDISSDCSEASCVEGDDNRFDKVDLLSVCHQSQGSLVSSSGCCVMLSPLIF